MPVPQHILEAISHYHETYRHPNLQRPEVSGIYSLFPEEVCSVAAQYRWPDSWPNADRPGVYFIFGPSMELLYVGKAAWLGRRLGDYFKWLAGRGSGCRIVHGGWKTRPAFLATAALSESFEAPALEEYLIPRVKPAENGLWITITMQEPNNAMQATCEDARA